MAGLATGSISFVCVLLPLLCQLYGMVPVVFLTLSLHEVSTTTGVPHALCLFVCECVCCFRGVRLFLVNVFVNRGGTRSTPRAT